MLSFNPSKAQKAFYIHKKELCGDFILWLEIEPAIIQSEVL